MASAPQSQDNTDGRSYSAMSVGEVEAIGAHCQAAFCHQLDFLPFRCESCKGSFCLDHRTETAHACPKAGEWARQRARRQQSPSTTSTAKATIFTHESQCSAPSCKTLVNTPLVPGIHCSTCNRDYCLKHRMQEDHECAKLTPIGARPSASNDRGIAEAFGKLRAWGAAKKAAAGANTATSSSSNASAGPAAVSRTATNSSTSSTTALQRIISPFRTSKPSKPAAHIAHVNSLKRAAHGDAKIPADKRVYVHLEAVASGEGRAGAKIPRADAFYSGEWSVGKVLDAAARTLSVANVNNRGGGEEEKLRVFHVEGGRLLEFAEKLAQTKVANGDTLVLLRGVGAPAVDA